jgi:peroxin-5
MFIAGGERFAEHQVGALLSSLRIDPGQLDGVPLGARGSVASEWANDFLGPPGAAQPGAWSDEFAQQQQFMRPPQWRPMGADPIMSSVHTGSEWANSFAAQLPPGGAGPGAAWGVDEFVAERQAAAGGRSQVDAAALDGASSAQTRALVQTLAANQEPKFQNSKFLQFVSKMSRGELIFEGNGVRERAAAPGDWGEEFARGADTRVGAAWGREFSEAAAAGPPAAVGGDWAAEFANVPSEWAEEFTRVHGVPPDASGDWVEAYDEFVAQHAQQDGAEAAWAEAAFRRGEYEFAENNPYTSHPDPLAQGIELFRRGVLSEAVLALEAAAARDPTACEPWRLLGTVHAENDDDRRAIAAMVRALAAQPDNREVLLSLGVSHTNELDAETAVNYVSRWLAQHATLRHLAPPVGVPLPAVVDAFRAASAEAPSDADVHTVLGVLYNLSRDYDAAIDAFSAALALTPGDYSLWNKLGATQANSARSAEALTAYRRALDLKPNYVRAWCNMGIGYANQGAYMQSAAYYVRALSLNPAADSVWGYLRISLSCIGREDLMSALDAHDLGPLLREFPL